MSIPEHFLENLEMILLEEIEALKLSAQQGVFVSPLDIANGYLSREHGDGQQLSDEDHTMALACIVGIALHWLAGRNEVAQNDC